MSTDEHIVRIVVGVKGSPNSSAALRWAGQEARLRGAEVWAVHAWSAPMEMFAPYASRRGVPSADQQRKTSSALLTAAIEYAFGSDQSGLVVRPILVEGPPIPVLLGYTAGAHLLVLGRRLRSEQTYGPTLGMVARSCVSNARCPTALIAETDVVADAENLPFLGRAYPWNNNHLVRRWRYDNRASDAG